jgi:Tol biopolymer transport system component
MPFMCPSCKPRRGIVLTLLFLAACGGSGGDHPSSPSAAQVTAVRVLTLDGGRLDWSPDGARLAFDRFGADGFFDVWVMNVDGSGEACLTCNHSALGLPFGHKGNPVWHPSGNWVVFQAEMSAHLGGSDIAKPGFGFFNELWAIRADGGAVHRILALTITATAQGTLHPCFNAAGDRLAWSHLVKGPTAGDPNLSSGEWRMRVAPFNAANDLPALGNWQEYVPGVPAFYETHAFAADDTGLLFSGNPDAGQTLLGMDEAIVDLGTGTLRRRVTATPTEWDEHARFPPGSTQIVFGSSRDLPLTASDPHADLWVIDESGNRRRLTYFNDPSWSLRPAGIPASVFTADGAFSPDGRAFANFLLLDPAAQTGAIVVLDLSAPL